MTTRKRTVPIKVPSDLYAQATATLKSRGTDLETWVRLQLKAFATNGKGLLTLKDQMPGGKYAGERIEDVCRADLAYAKWMLAQDWSTKYDTDVHQLVEELSQ